MRCVSVIGAVALLLGLVAVATMVVAAWTTNALSAITRRAIRYVYLQG